MEELSSIFTFMFYWSVFKKYTRETIWPLIIEQTLGLTIITI